MNRFANEVPPMGPLSCRPTSIDYSDCTPDAVFAYDRLGRMTSASNGVATTAYGDDANLRPDTERS